MILNLKKENEGITFGVSSIFIPDDSECITNNSSAHNLSKGYDMEIGSSLVVSAIKGITRGLELRKNELKEIGFNIENLCFAFSIMCFDKKELEKKPDIVIETSASLVDDGDSE